MPDIKEILGIKEKIALSQKDIPKHLALTMNGSFRYARRNKLDSGEVAKQDFVLLKSFIKTCIKLKIPITSFYICSEKMKESPNFEARMDSLEDFLTSLQRWEFLDKNLVKISVLGKWYDLPSRVVEPIKQVISLTKDYDAFFVNLCINYDGKEEIVDACKMLARQVKAGKADPESIDQESIKNNLYSSFFIPPELIIKTGRVQKLNSFLLWDSAYSKIHFSGKLWPEFSKLDILKAISAAKDY